MENKSPGLDAILLAFFYGLYDEVGELVVSVFKYML